MNFLSAFHLKIPLPMKDPNFESELTFTEKGIMITKFNYRTTAKFESLSFRDRKCALAKEKGNLRFLLNYTKSGCEYECGLDRAAKKCSCIPWNLPRMPGTNITKPFLLLSAKF